MKHRKVFSLSFPHLCSQRKKLVWPDHTQWNMTRIQLFNSYLCGSTACHWLNIHIHWMKWKFKICWFANKKKRTWGWTNWIIIYQSKPKPVNTCKLLYCSCMSGFLTCPMYTWGPLVGCHPLWSKGLCWRDWQRWRWNAPKTERQLVAPESVAEGNLLSFIMITV